MRVKTLVPRVDGSGVGGGQASRAGGLRAIAAVALAAGVTLVGAACAPAIAPAPAPQSTCGMDTVSSAELGALNADRAAANLPALAANGQLICLAQSWSHSMASNGTLVHQNLGVLLASPAYAGYTTLGENILEGPSGMTADQMNTAWMNSPDHRANILSPAYRWVGIGLAYANGAVWATEDFGG